MNKSRLKLHVLIYKVDKVIYKVDIMNSEPFSEFYTNFITHSKVIKQKKDLNILCSKLFLKSVF